MKQGSGVGGFWGAFGNLAMLIEGFGIQPELDTDPNLIGLLQLKGFLALGGFSGLRELRACTAIEACSASPPPPPMLCRLGGGCARRTHRNTKSVEGSFQRAWVFLSLGA